MLKRILLLAVLGLACGGLEEESGPVDVFSETDRQAIINGSNVPAYKYESTFRVTPHWCDGAQCLLPRELWSLATATGTLVAPDVILTAGHAVNSLPSHEGYWISVNNLEGTISEAEFWTCWYNGQNWDMDFALIKLNSSMEGVTPVTLLETDDTVAVGDEVTLAGFGCSKDDDPLSGRIYKRYGTATIDSIETAQFLSGTDSNDADGCPGDSGGPAFKAFADGKFPAARQSGIIRAKSSVQTYSLRVDTKRATIKSWVEQNSEAWDTINVPASPVLFAYSATNTAGATQNYKSIYFSLTRSTTVDLGTCGVSGSSGSGDTYLRLYRGGSQVAYNDDSCGLMSRITHTPSTYGTYELRAGCYSGGSCSGTVAIAGADLCATQPLGTFSGSGSGGYSGSNCLAGYTFAVQAGRSYTVSTCGSYSGDPYLKVTGSCSCTNDDSCGLGSKCTCTATSTGTATICASSYSSSAATWNYQVTCK